MMIEFKEWAKDKVFYSTNKEYIADPYRWMIMEDEHFSSTKLLNGVPLKEGDKYIWKLNTPPTERIRKELEGWVYKEDYDKVPFKYQDPDMWNPIPDEYRNINIKQ